MRTINLSGVSQELALLPAPVLYYRGFSVRETTGAATALIRIWDNATAASGLLLDVIALVANESARENYDTAKTATAGIFVEIVSGAVAGSIGID